MQARILDASLRVLRDQGALGFTTTRVADEAGISVGSLYQYFPNKHALVSALHDRDVGEGVAHVQAILDQPNASPRQKLHEIVSWFFSTEAEEAATLVRGRILQQAAAAVLQQANIQPQTALDLLRF